MLCLHSLQKARLVKADQFTQQCGIRDANVQNTSLDAPHAGLAGDLVSRDLPPDFAKLSVSLHSTVASRSKELREGVSKWNRLAGSGRASRLRWHRHLPIDSPRRPERYSRASGITT